MAAPRLMRGEGLDVQGRSARCGVGRVPGGRSLTWTADGAVVYCAGAREAEGRCGLLGDRVYRLEEDLPAR